jgi:hypothetical protein
VGVSMRTPLPGVMLAVLAGVPALPGCARSRVATLVVDHEHSQVGQPEGKEGVKYVLSPVTRVRLDARHFDFSRSLFPDTRPTAVQLVVGKERQYSAPWDESGLVELSQSTLVPMNNSAPFTGLAAGDRVIVAIGEQRTDEKTHQIVLKVLWVGLIDVTR